MDALDVIAFTTLSFVSFAPSLIRVLSQPLADSYLLGVQQTWNAATCRLRTGGESLCLSRVRLLHLLRFVPVMGIRCTPPRKPFNP